MCYTVINGRGSPCDSFYLQAYENPALPFHCRGGKGSPPPCPRQGFPYTCPPGVRTASRFLLLPFLLPFPVKRIWTCSENLIACLQTKQNISPMLLCPCYLSNLLVGCPVEVEAANLHPKWRCRCSAIPQPSLFQSHSSASSRVCPLGSCWPSPEFIPSSHWVTKGKSSPCSPDSVYTAKCYQKLWSPRLVQPQEYDTLTWHSVASAKHTVEKWMQQLTYDI